MMQTRWMRSGLATLAACTPGLVLAQQVDPKPWQLNMTRGVTETARTAYDLHMLAFAICCAIGLIVFGAMAFAMVRFRKSKGAVAAQFSHNTKAEIIWTIVPVLLLIAMAWPATAKLLKQYDMRNSTMTVKVTGYQWMWKYDFMGQGVQLTSRLARSSDELRQSGKVPTLADNRHYLLEVDHPLVLPTNTKIRFVVTADDVIHSWWVPALGWKQDAIPGIVNEAWTSIEQPGIYRGQCAELCGKDHGFMPIVVQAVPKAEFDQWLAARKAEQAPPAPAPVAPPAAPAPTPAAPATPGSPTAAATAPASASSAG